MVIIRQYSKFNSNCFLYSALAICLLAVLAIATEARHVKKTQNRGNVKILSLIEKMKNQRLLDVFPSAQVEYYVGENDTRFLLQDEFHCEKNQEYSGDYCCRRDPRYYPGVQCECCSANEYGCCMTYRNGDYCCQG